MRKGRFRKNLHVILDKLRSSADPGSIVTLGARRWIPAQARDDVVFPSDLQALTRGREPASQRLPLGRRHPGEVVRRHRMGHHRLRPDGAGMNRDLIGLVQHHTLRCDLDPGPGRLGRMAHGAAPGHDIGDLGRRQSHARQQYGPARLARLEAKLLALPTREDVSVPIQEQLVVELLSK